MAIWPKRPKTRVVDAFFVATFGFKNGQLATFFGQFALFVTNFSKNFQKICKLATFCPLLKMKMATKFYLFLYFFASFLLFHCRQSLSFKESDLMKCRLPISQISVLPSSTFFRLAHVSQSFFFSIVRIAPYNIINSSYIIIYFFFRTTPFNIIKNFIKIRI